MPPRTAQFFRALTPALLALGLGLSGAAAQTGAPAEPSAPPPAAMAPSAPEPDMKLGEALATGRYMCAQEIQVSIGYKDGVWQVDQKPTTGSFMIEVDDVILQGGETRQRVRVIDRNGSLIAPDTTFWYQQDVTPKQGFDFPADIPHERQLFTSKNGQLWIYDSPENEGLMMLFSGLLIEGAGAGTIAGLCEYIDLPS